MSADLQRIDPNQEKTWKEIQADIDREMLLRHFVSESYAECVRLRVEAEIMKAEEELAREKRKRTIKRFEHMGTIFLYLIVGWVILGVVVLAPIGLTISNIVRWR